MVSSYQGHYSFTSSSVQFSAPEAKGVYYCGFVSGDTLVPCYIGKAARGRSSIRDRLQEHLTEEQWPKVTHFGFCTTSNNPIEADQLEAAEIAKYQPRYNTVGKT